MKKIIAASFLGLLVNLTIYAGNGAELKASDSRGNGNPITVYNKTDADVAYVMETFFFDAIYYINKGSEGIYKSKYADEYVTVAVGEPLHNKSGNIIGVDYNSLQNCVNNVHYNGNLIRSIEITSLKSCTVICLDGGSTSCKQGG
jgi:hypothetical protein